MALNCSRMFFLIALVLPTIVLSRSSVRDVQSNIDSTYSNSQGTIDSLKCRSYMDGYEPGKSVYLPSEVVPFISQCEKINITGPECPSCNMAGSNIDGKRSTFFKSFSSIDMNSTSCTSSWTIEYSTDPELYKSPGEKFAMECFTDKFTFPKFIFTVKRSSYKGPCQSNIDCIGYNLECHNGHCICYGDTPSFVPATSKCFTAAKYDGECIYDEQCETTTKDSVCKHQMCQCKDNYYLDGNQDCKSDSRALFPHVMVILGTMFLTTLKT